MNKEIYFDLDGTICDLYGVENWLEHLRNYSAYPYMAATPLVNLSVLARMIHKAQSKGYTVGVISWLSKCSSPEYDKAVTAAKLAWLKRHMPSVTFDEIHIVAYGTPKHGLGCGYLFDDEIANRTAWSENPANTAYDVDNIIGVLKEMLK